MELKETSHLPNPVEINVVKPSDKNKSDKQSIYDIFMSAEEDVADENTNNKHSDVDNEERKFGNVSTLDWLQTWRSTEIS